MQEFLQRLETPEMQRLYAVSTRRWNERAAALNPRLGERGLPVRVANLSSIWTVCYTSRRATTGCSSTTCAPRAWR